MGSITGNLSDGLRLVALHFTLHVAHNPHTLMIAQRLQLQLGVRDLGPPTCASSTNWLLFQLPR
jgi:hypothetical protein